MRKVIRRAAAVALIGWSLAVLGLAARGAGGPDAIELDALADEPALIPWNATDQEYAAHVAHQRALIEIGRRMGGAAGGK